VIHAVGPIWGSGDEDAKLHDCVYGSLRLADELKCASVALPAISTGIFGFPKERAVGVILRAIKEYFEKERSTLLSMVRMTLFDKDSVDVFLNAGENL
jgi:O-acetyl-ADP-ribose deacetylase (regulator of RNase III)